MSMTSQMVLLVDDDPNDAFFLQSAFKEAKLPLALKHLNNGQRAVEYLQGLSPYAPRKEHPLPDLVLLDLKMPLKNGFEVLAWIRRQADLKDLPVIILSSSDEEKDVRRCKSLGATAYLVKSSECSDVIDQVKRILGISG